MKKIVIIGSILASLAVAHVGFGQTPGGVILYEVKINLHRRLPPDRETMKDAIPEFNVHQEELFFNETASLYKPMEEDEDEFEADGGGMRMRFRRPHGEYYTDQAMAASIVQQDIMGKKYLIQDSLSVLPWKLGTETKTILGYICRQASYYNEERKQEIVAWYTDTLRPFLGPERFNSLPGGVLQVDVNAGETVITAQQVTLRPLKKNELKAPTGGERITQTEFQKVSREQMQRMGRGPRP
ncbi:GLPGLI family protein [Fulvivirgaceae bacterium PWU5]|uniref:GLPGLI family protein n=1 Tax=Dawidia cretensis TaxID=2782350 RepID=A0AAP2GR70_9BACT|nr:GLPGLI family protein [Dawidia cretensis]MBT1710039.1 GLPGLI family protein [Dawidia cretensis]